MHRARLVAIGVALAALTTTPADAAGGETSGRLVRWVERMADRYVMAPSERKDDRVCRWATQSMSYQGVNHTRRVRVCERQSWWDELVRKAKASTSRSRPRPG